MRSDAQTSRPGMPNTTLTGREGPEDVGVVRGGEVVGDDCLPVDAHDSGVDIEAAADALTVETTFQASAAPCRVELERAVAERGGAARGIDAAALPVSGGGADAAAATGCVGHQR